MTQPTENALQTYLDGLRVGPMGAWLATIGLLRAIHRHPPIPRPRLGNKVGGDPDASTWWEDDTPILSADNSMLPNWLATEYDLPPAITPWQLGGGWGPKDTGAGNRLTRLRASTNPRLADLRAAITAADTVMADQPTNKAEAVRRLRNWAPEPVLAWIDAVVPAELDGATGHAPIAGTGGNDGRWDMSTTYHECVLAVLDNQERSEAWAYDLLAGTNNTPLLQMSAGPYWPTATHQGLVNPWAMILLVEGVMAFGDAHRTGAMDRGQRWTTKEIGPNPEMPATEPDKGWGEAWLPLWNQPMTYPEVTVLLGDQWPRWRGGPALRPTQMYQSLAAGLGPANVDRVLRYGLAMRRGRSHTAVQLDTLDLREPTWVRLTAKGAADCAGVAPRTWSSYVTRGQAPAPDGKDDLTGVSWWWSTTVDAWLALRPGQGARTDPRLDAVEWVRFNAQTGEPIED